MNLGFNIKSKNKLIIFVTMAFLLCINTISMPLSTFGLFTIQELAANDISVAKKNDSGFVEIDFKSKNGNYLDQYKETLQKISLWQNNDRTFVTYDDYSPTYIFEDTTLQDEDVYQNVSIVGLASFFDSQLPLQMKEVTPGFYLSSLEILKNERGSIVSKSFADAAIAAGVADNYEDLIGKQVHDIETTNTLVVCSVVDDDSFFRSQVSTISNCFIVSYYRNISFSTDTYRNYRIFLESDYAFNYSLFNIIFTHFYLQRTFYYLDLITPGNDWIANELNALVGGQKLPNITFVLIVLLFVSSIAGFLLSFYCAKHGSLFIEKKKKFIFVILFFTVYCTVSLLISYAINGLIVFGFHSASQTSRAFLFELLYPVFMLAGFLIGNAFFKDKNLDKKSDLYLIEI